MSSSSGDFQNVRTAVLRSRLVNGTVFKILCCPSCGRPCEFERGQPKPGCRHAFEYPAFSEQKWGMVASARRRYLVALAAARSAGG